MQTGLTTINEWSFPKKFIVRFFASYFFIYIFPFPLAYISFLQNLNNWYNHFLSYLISFSGKHIFNIGFILTATHNGSGDTTYNYVKIFLLIVFTFIATIIWSITDKKRKNFDHILYWIFVYLRFYLALMMMRYGLEKIIKTQFPFPFYSLNETYGASSPMRLLWTFMGYSTPFNVFTGLVEIAGGVFLLFKKTSTFGVLVTIAALTNVVVINFCYDVPVKLFAANLLLVAIFILIPDVKRVTDFFFCNKAVPAVYVQPTFKKQWMKPVLEAVTFILFIATLYSIIMFVWNKYNVSGDGAFKKTPLFGIYNVEKFIKNNDASQTHIADSFKWKTVNIIFPKQAVIEMKDNNLKAFNFFADTSNKKIMLYKDDDSTNKSTMSYFMEDSTHLILYGKLEDDSVYIQLHKQDLNTFPLLNRKFHWINEAPYNK
ncbi:MAG: hypothetical protein ABJA35_09060 [Parafilimonas sp.]